MCHKTNVIRPIILGKYDVRRHCLVTLPWQTQHAPGIEAVLPFYQRKWNNQLKDQYHNFTLSQTSPSFYVLQYKSFENTVGKGEIAGNEHFLLFPQCFSICLENFQSFSLNLELSSAHSFTLEESKVCRLGKG